MNLRTNFKVKVKKYQNHKMISNKWFTFRYSNANKRFLTEITRNYLGRINFEKGLTCSITVYYCSKKANNSSIYNNQKDLLHAFECFTEQDLLNEYWDKVLRTPKTLTSAHKEHLKRMRMLNKSKVTIQAQKKL
jgi:hypothetical protein